MKLEVFEMKRLFVILFALVVSVFGQRMTTSPGEISQRALPKLRQAIQSHPESLVREKLWGWLGSEKVLFAANNILPEMSASLEEYKGRKQVLLWYNVDFLLQVPQVASSEDKQVYLWLVLYHEAIHIDDHFSGRMPLGPILPTAPTSITNIAEDIWNREWSAVTKEWILAKKLRKPYLVPMIYATTKNGETPKTFLRGFYQLQMSGNAVLMNPRLSAGFTLCYKQELAKLSTH